MTDWLDDWLSDWLTDWLTDWLIAVKRQLFSYTKFNWKTNKNRIGCHNVVGLSNDTAANDREWLEATFLNLTTVIMVVSWYCNCAKSIPRQPVAEDVTLASRSAEDRLQSGFVDVRSPQHWSPSYFCRLIRDREHGRYLRSTTTFFHNDWTFAKRAFDLLIGDKSG